MTDHIARDREEHSDHRRDEGREEEDECQERKKLQNDTEYGIVHEAIDRDILHHEHRDEDHRLEGYHDEYDEGKSEEFPEDDTRSMDRLREHQVDRATFDLSSNHPSAEEEYDSKSRELDEGEAEIIENALDLTECERIECEGDEDEESTEEEDEGEKSIPHEFADGIEGDGEHRREQSLSRESKEWYCIILSGRTVGIFGQIHLNDGLWAQRVCVPAWIWEILDLLEELISRWSHLHSPSGGADNDNKASDIREMQHILSYIL